MEDPEQENEKLRHLLFRSHHGIGHELSYKGGEMVCHSCGIDFGNDPVDRIEARLGIQHHAQFRQQMETETLSTGG